MSINKPTGWDDEKRTNIQELTGEKKSEISETLFWNKEAILKDLKEHHVKIEENAEMMWFKWKKIRLELPAVWNFEGFKFDCFVSDESIEKKSIEKKFFLKKESKLEEKSYSMQEIWELLEAINTYMKELWIDSDENMDYKNDLQTREKGKFHRDVPKSKAWNYLKSIIGLDSFYWLKDKNVWYYNGKPDKKRNDSRATLIWKYDSYSFGRDARNHGDSNLLLRISN